jgi:methyltransferase (TIGR00027 family)
VIASMKDTMKQCLHQIPSTRSMGLRARWVEDLIKSAIASGITQIVNPACGLDTYAWRLNLPSHVTYYELDFPEVMEYKSSKLADVPVLCKYKPISIDLRDESWTQKLTQSGFDSKKEIVTISNFFQKPRKLSGLLWGFSFTYLKLALMPS